MVNFFKIFLEWIILELTASITALVNIRFIYFCSLSSKSIQTDYLRLLFGDSQNYICYVILLWPFEDLRYFKNLRK